MLAAELAAQAINTAPSCQQTVVGSAAVPTPCACPTAPTGMPLAQIGQTCYRKSTATSYGCYGTVTGNRCAADGDWAALGGGGGGGGPLACPSAPATFPAAAYGNQCYVGNGVYYGCINAANCPGGADPGDWRQLPNTTDGSRIVATPANGITLWPGVTEPAADSTSNTFGPGGTNVNGNTINYAGLLALYDYFIGLDPNTTVTKTSIGLDQSGTYTMYSYTFMPVSGYNRTIMVTSDMQDETGGALGAWRFFYHAIGATGEPWQSMRTVRYIVVPVGNPWGVNNVNTLNSRGVNINRNWPWNWTAYAGPDPKGASALSEAETQNINAVLLASGAVASIECHNQGVSTAGTDFDLFVPDLNTTAGAPTGLNVDYSAADTVVSYLTTASTTSHITISDSDPNLFNYAASLGMNAIGVDAGIRPATADAYLNSSWMTHYVRLAGNIILSESQSPTNQQPGAPVYITGPVKCAGNLVHSGHDVAILVGNGSGCVTEGRIADSGTNFEMPGPLAVSDAALLTDPAAEIQSDATKNAANTNAVANYHLFLHYPASTNNIEVGLCMGISTTNVCGAAITHKRIGTGSYGNLNFYTLNSSSAWGVRTTILANGGFQAFGAVSNGTTTATSSDNRGHITLVAGTGSYTFTQGPGTAGIWTTAPVCIIQDDTTLANLATSTKTVTATALTITGSVGTTDVYSYICWPGN
jgi:hypothetical protein